MTMTTVPGEALVQVEAALAGAGQYAAAPAWHGRVCGLACVLGASLPEGIWLPDPVAAEPDPEALGLLARFATDAAGALARGDMSFRLLLPGDEQSLALRAAGLAEWSEGFLEGLSSSAARSPGQAQALFANQQVREILEDLGEIARAGHAGAADNEAESAFAELVEFVRVGAQLVFEEARPVRDSVTH